MTELIVAAPVFPWSGSGVRYAAIAAAYLVIRFLSGIVRMLDQLSYHLVVPLDCQI